MKDRSSENNPAEGCLLGFNIDNRYACWLLPQNIIERNIAYRALLKSWSAIPQRSNATWQVNLAANMNTQKNISGEAECLIAKCCCSHFNGDYMDE
jgi:hypothetical protein